MSGAVRDGYLPVYPRHGEPQDPDVRTFITNFYRVSDRPDANELWISHFTKDAQVTMGPDKARGEQEIRELWGRMWTSVRERKHSVVKVFPGRFQDADAEEPVECEVMLFGEVKLKTRDDKDAAVSWAGHAVLKRETQGAQEEWKFAHYQVWLQP